MTGPISDKERIRSLESQLAFLAGAATALVLESYRIHDTEPWPLKYRAPFRTIANLARILESLDYVKEIGVAEQLAARREVAELNNEVRERLGLEEDAP